MREVTTIFAAILFMALSQASAETSSKIRITKISGEENGATQSSLDVVQDSCGSGGTPTPEEFTDSYLKVTVKNESDFVLTFTGAQLSVRDSDGANTRYRSAWLAPTGQIEVGKGESQELTIPFLKFQGSSKTFVGNSAAIPGDLGFRTVNVQLRARIAKGRRVTTRAKASFGFGNEDRCS